MPGSRDGIAAETETNGPRACIECRRLKRKCNRQQPCDICLLHNRSCSYAQSSRTPLTRSRLTEVEDQLAKLRSLLETHAPHVDIVQELRETRLSTPSSSMQKEHTPFVARSSSPSRSSRRGSTPYNPHPLPQTPVSQLRHPSLPEAGSLSDGWPNSIPTPASSSALVHTLPTDSIPRRQTAIIRPQPDPMPASLLPEKQPRTAAGYEWNERAKSTRKAGDGTASLSIEPDGEGYLGFASGATLLRILQICAGGLALPSLITDSNDPSDHTISPSYEPTFDDMNEFVEAYFKMYHTQYPLVHEPTFRAQWNEVVPPPPSTSWDILVNTILAIGAFCSRPAATQIADFFMDAATSRLSVQQLESGSLTLVQAFTLLSNLAQKRNKPNAGSVYLGIAVRMAIGLGLHRELPLWGISPFERESRRRVWWVLFIFDSGACITFGRPILLPSHEADVKMVLNMTDRGLTPVTKTIPLAVADPTVYSSLVHQAGLHVVGNRGYTRVIASPPPNAEEVLGLIADLDAWKNGLPSYFVGNTSPPDTHPWLDFAVQKLFWRFCNLRIIFLRRPFLERALKRQPLNPSLSDEKVEGFLSPLEVAERRCVRLCMQSARDTIRSIHEFFSTHVASPLEWWYGLHFLFHASFVPLIALHTDPQSTSADSWHADVVTARSTLELRQGNALAERCLQIIHLLTPPPFTPNRRTEDAAGGSSLDIDTSFDIFANLDAGQLSGLDGALRAGDSAHEFLPLADFATLATFWPTS